MFGSLLMLGSTNRKCGKMNYMFAVLWIIYMLFGSNFQTGLMYVIINFLVFALVFLIGKIIKGKYSNQLVSIFSIVLWSALIDTICYYFYPKFVLGQSLISYVGNGIYFNIRFALVNAAVVGAVEIAKLYFEKRKENNKVVKSI